MRVSKAGCVCVQTCAFTRCHAGGVRTFEIEDVQDDERDESVEITLSMASETRLPSLWNSTGKKVMTQRISLTEYGDLTAFELCA